MQKFVELLTYWILVIYHFAIKKWFASTLHLVSTLHLNNFVQRVLLLTAFYCLTKKWSLWDFCGQFITTIFDLISILLYFILSIVCWLTNSMWNEDIINCCKSYVNKTDKQLFCRFWFPDLLKHNKFTKLLQILKIFTHANHFLKIANIFEEKSNSLTATYRCHATHLAFQLVFNKMRY